MFQFNDQFSKTASQFTDVAAQVSRLTLANAEKAARVHLSALEDNLTATFAYASELVEARDLDAMKSVWPKGLQVARANAERALGAAQEAFAHTLKTQEAIGELAKQQFEQAIAQVRPDADKATKASKPAAKSPVS